MSSLRLDGRAIEIAWWGPDTDAADPIVLLHEGLGSVRQWRDFPARLAAHAARRVMAYSRWGHGLSDPPATPHTVHFMHEEARRLPAILDAAGVTRAVLLGHSDGGSIALLFAAEHPARTSALMLEAPHVFVEDCSVASIRRTTADYLRGDLRSRLAKYHSHVDVAFHGWSDVWLDAAFRQWNLEGVLPDIVCPTLLIQGTDDEYGTLAQVKAIAREIRGESRVVVLANCGHAPHRDQTDQVLNEMTAFLTRLHPARGPQDRSTAG